MKRFARVYDTYARDVLAPRARDMRNAPTRSEEVVWQWLRRKNLGYRFRRQVLLGPYIVDFYCPALKLAIEVDGGSHNGREALDAHRDEHLKALGVSVLRLKV